MASNYRREPDFSIKSLEHRPSDNASQTIGLMSAASSSVLVDGKVGRSR